VLALAFLAFVAGATVTRFELFPYPFLKDAFLAAEALLERERDTRNPHGYGAKPLVEEDFAAPQVRDTEPGLGRYDALQAYAGYTVYTPVGARYPVSLIDMQGQVLHEWTVPRDSLSAERIDGLSLSGSAVRTIAYPRLFPNGDMLMVLGTEQQTPWGFGIIKVDKDSQLLWEYTRQAHHDLDVGPDGRIYGLVHSTVTTPWPGLEAIETPFVDDQVAVLDADGNELKVVSILQAIQGSDFESLLIYADPEYKKGDFLHTNSITYLDEQKAASFPNAQAGDVLLSLRQIDVLAVMDIDAETIKWAARGTWHFQHDPDVLEDGNVLLFDNRGDLKNGARSRILEFNPRTLEVVWEYPDDQDEHLYTSIYGSQQRLPNGNTLISESNNGRILEVTRSGDIVWEFKVPERSINRRGDEIATVVFAERVAPDQLEFLAPR
jgi:outer membrane protein assembly factor BamB